MMTGDQQVYCFPEGVDFEGSQEIFSSLKASGHLVKTFLSRDKDDSHCSAYWCVLMTKQPRITTVLRPTSRSRADIANAAKSIVVAQDKQAGATALTLDLEERARLLGFKVIYLKQLQEQLRNLPPQLKNVVSRPHPRIVVEDLVCGYPTMELVYTPEEAENRFVNWQRLPPPGIPLFTPRDQWEKVTAAALAPTRDIVIYSTATPPDLR